MLGHIPRKLRHADLVGEVPLEGCVEDLALRHLEAVHDARDGSFQVVGREVDEVLVDEVGVGDERARRNLERLVVALEPHLAIIGTLLVEGQINRLVGSLAEVKGHRLEGRKVGLGLVARGGAQSLVVFDRPALGALGCPPGLIVHLAGEGLDRRALGGLDDGRGHVGQEPRDGDELMPELVEQVDEQAPDVGSVIVLIGHDHDAPVAELGQARVLLPGLEPQNLLQLRNLLGMLDLGIRGVLHIQHLALERVDAVVFALLLRESRERHGLGRVPLGQDEGTLGRVLGARRHRIVQLGNARDAALLLPIRLAIVLGVLGGLDGENGLDNVQLGDDLLQRLVGELGTASERRDLGGQGLLGLARKRRILNERDDKHSQMLLDRRILGLALLLGLQILRNGSNNLIGDRVDVSPTFAGPDAVDEGRLHESLAWGGRHDDGPPVIGGFLDNGLTAEGLGIVDQGPAGDEGSIPADLDLLADSHGEIGDPTLNQPNHALRQSIRVAEPRIVWQPAQTDRALGLGGRHRGRVDPGHVGVERLLIA